MKYNFNAGPSFLPAEVLKQASEAVINFNGINLSLLELSHRTSDFESIINESVHLVKELLSVPQGYSVIFLEGGASTQFAMVPFNFLPEGGKAAYLETGVWAEKAIKEARYFGDIAVVASSRDKSFTYIPKNFDIPNDAAYLHVTSNNTIYGTQVQQFFTAAIPLVCDMSSDIFSRSINVADFGLIYAAAQKNIGTAGATLVIVKDEFLHTAHSKRLIPSMFDYQVHIKHNSMYHTPPVFTIYTCLLVLRWLKAMGGVQAIEQSNTMKARLLYQEIDRNPLFKGMCVPEDRSKMNVTFVAESPKYEQAFLEFVEEEGVVGIKGHRSVGGFRASIYNAVPVGHVHLLIDLMQKFTEQYQSKK